MLVDTLQSRRVLYAMDEADFIRNMEEGQTRFLGLLDEVQVTDEAFAELIRQNNKWEYAGMRMSFKFLKERRNKDFQISENFLDFQNGLDINDTSNLKYDGFESYIQTYVNDLVWSAFDQLDSATFDQFFEIQFNTIHSEITVPSIKRPFLYDLVRSYGVNINEEMLDQIVAEWRATNPEQKGVTEMESMLAVLENTKPGKQAPAFNYVSYEGGFCNTCLARRKGSLR